LNGQQLVERFKVLPDGRYRLVLFRKLGDELLDERTVLETVIKNGVPTNPIDEAIEQIRRQLDRDDDDMGINEVEMHVHPLISQSLREPEGQIRIVDQPKSDVPGGFWGAIRNRFARKTQDSDQSRGGI